MMDAYKGVDTVVTGTEVYGSDGEKLGVVAEVSDDHMVVERGLLSTKKLCIPYSSVRRVGHGVVYLTVSRSEAKGMGGE